MTQEIKNIHTSCQNCVFGVYQENSKTQTDCELDLINLYGKDVLEAYNEDGEFYIINGRKCYFKRDLKWAGDLTSNELFKKVHDETKINYAAIIIGDNDLQDIKNTITSLLQQQLQPKFIAVLRKFRPTIRAEDLNPILISTGKKWRVSTPRSPEITPDFLVTGILDLFYKKYPVYLTIEAGKTIKDEWLMMKVNRKIIFDNAKFGLIDCGDNIRIGNSFINKLYRGMIDPACMIPLTSLIG